MLTILRVFPGLTRIFHVEASVCQYVLVILSGFLMLTLRYRLPKFHPQSLVVLGRKQAGIPTNLPRRLGHHSSSSCILAALQIAGSRRVLLECVCVCGGGRLSHLATLFWDSLCCVSGRFSAMGVCLVALPGRRSYTDEYDCVVCRESRDINESRVLTVSEGGLSFHSALRFVAFQCALDG